MITSLTPEQKSKLKQYRDEGIAIGLDTNDEYDLEVVKPLIEQIRSFSTQKLPPVKNWIQVDSPYAALKYDAKPDQALFGCHDISWAQTHNFFRQECGLVEQTERSVPFLELAKMIGWFWFSEDTVLISRKPCHLSLSYRKRGDEQVPVAHDPNRMAIQYRDGTGCYMMDGVEMPAWLYEEEGSRTPKRILAIKNVDVRNAALKLLGADGLIGAVPHDVLEERAITTRHTPKGKLGSEYGDLAALFSVPLSEYKEETTNYRLIGFELNGVYRLYLNGVCPSKKEQFTEAVHPDCNTINKALSWRETGIISDDYQPPAVRT